MVKVAEVSKHKNNTASAESKITQKSTPRPSRLQAQTGPHLAVEAEYHRRH